MEWMFLGVMVIIAGGAAVFSFRVWFGMRFQDHRSEYTMIGCLIMLGLVIALWN